MKMIYIDENKSCRDKSKTLVRQRYKKPFDVKLLGVDVISGWKNVWKESLVNFNTSIGAKAPCKNGYKQFIRQF